MKGVGEPGAGEPHARIDGRGWKRSDLATVTGVAQPTGKPAEDRPQALPSGTATAPALDPTNLPCQAPAHSCLVAYPPPGLGASDRDEGQPSHRQGTVETGEDGLRVEIQILSQPYAGVTEVRSTEFIDGLPGEGAGPSESFG